MISLAPWKYRNVLKCDGGPIEKISAVSISEGENQGYQAHAYLLSNLRTNKPWKPQLYGEADGTGFARHRNQAVFRAISEALERWAYLHTFEADNRSAFGFNIDPTTSGMAAYPGISSHGAASFARLEAIERWSLCAWWEGAIYAKIKSDPSNLGITIILLAAPWKDVAVTILHKRSAKKNLGCYGFAAANDVETAVAKAKVELFRNEVVLDECESVSFVESMGLPRTEQRLLYFSGYQGIENFMCRIQNLNTRQRIQMEPPMLVDKEIRGPWSKYGTVWRSLFQPVSSRFLTDGADYFLF